MPVIRINAEDSTPVLHGSHQPLSPALTRALKAKGPVVILIHGYKFRPHDPVHCPHRHIFALDDIMACERALSWPKSLGFGSGATDEGLAIAFGWNARGSLRAAHRRGSAAGTALARLLQLIARDAPDRPVHLISHSLGAHVALSALPLVAPGTVRRLILLNGAVHQSRAQAALATAGGHGVELFNVTSGENRFFDLLFETTMWSTQRGDRALGRGIDLANALTLRIDCRNSLTALQRLGIEIAPPQHRVCHWSTYLRPGVFALYQALIRDPEALPLAQLRRALVAPAPASGADPARPRMRALLPG
ncbi:alpha/beta hydrolase [Shimia biformata]|uniref:alpha/beta hydrolase n=1 Tax=Shimia biformata TaxID=1294299 RepID=UPI0019515F6E|nr:alpha/beta hydrolase [Shimia biformata]